MAARTQRRVVTGVAVLVAVLVAVSLYASPYWTVHRVREAARRGDADTVSAHVDFPALRESLKGSMGAFMVKQMAKDTTMRGNPFAAFGAGLAMMMGEKMVDMMVTPEGVRAMIEGQRPLISTLAPKLGDGPRLSECQAIKSIREDKKIRGVVIAALNIVPFWQCTATQLAEAEKMLTEKEGRPK